MNKKTLLIIVGIVLAGFGLSLSETAVSFGSVADGQGYYATSTAAGTGFAGVHKQVRSGNSTLGSVIIASSSPVGTFTIWNATSTTDTASTTIVSFPVSPSAGTYTFDVEAPRGLVVSSGTGFIGNYTVTFK